MFEVLKKFAGRHKEQRRNALRDNAKGILKRDHLIAQLQEDQGKSAALAAGDASRPSLPPPAMTASPQTSAAAAATAMTSRKPRRSKKPAKPMRAEHTANAFEFIAEIDLELKGTAPEPAPAAEAPGLPPDFEAKLKHLRDLMDF